MCLQLLKQNIMNYIKISCVILIFVVISSDAHRKYRPKNPKFPAAANVNPGIIATRGEFPWVVSFPASVVLFCSGSLIDANWVLTAAQCVPIPSASYDVTLGCTNSAVSELERVVVKTSLAIVHPKYEAATRANNVALLKLETPATLSSYVKPIRLPRSSYDANLLVGTRAAVSGWSYTREAIYHNKRVTERTVGNSLRYMNVGILSNAECQAKISIHRNMMCSFVPGKTACVGDVGGALVHMEEDYLPTQVGVTSSANVTCEIISHTRVTSVLSWIYATTGIAERI